FCDPDFYPVAHEVTDEEISARVAEIRKNADEYQAILAHLGLPGVVNLSPEQARLVDNEHKRLSALQLTPTAQGYSFNVRIVDAQGNATAVEGHISLNGDVTTTNQQPTIAT